MLARTFRKFLSGRLSQIGRDYLGKREMEENEILEDEPRLGPTTLRGGLRASLARLERLRESLPPEKRNPLPVGSVVNYQGQVGRTKPTISKENLAKAILTLDVIYSGQNLDESQMTLRYQVFYDVLRHLSPLEMNAAVERYFKSDATFAPTPGQLLKLAR
jgi:hypothetical protein